MLSLLFKTKKKRTLEESVLLIQQGDRALLNELIDSYKPFIAKTVSSVCKRYIRETDDEFSIGPIAFNEAIDKYSSERGSSLLSFAEVLIKRRVIDYIRKQTKNKHLSVNFNDVYQEDESPGNSIVNELSFEDYKKEMETEGRKEEISQFQELLKTFDLSLNDLIASTPKHVDARRNAILIAKTLVDHDDLRKLLLEKKRLPIKQLEHMVNVSRKTIERNRKYIIAIALILMSDYIYMKDYLKGGSRDMKKGIVMQIDDAYLTLLTPDGQFLQARKRNYPYVVGEEIVFTPIEHSKKEGIGVTAIFSLKPLLIAAAVLLLVIGSYVPVYQSNKAYAYMSIDVNPSIEIGINKQMQVVELNPFNADGKKIIAKLDHWQKQEVSKIAELILEEMKKEGYLKDNHLVIISTVRTEKAEAQVEKQLTKNIDEIKEAAVKKDHLQLSILTGTKADMEKAHQLGMTTGKYKENQTPVNQNWEDTQNSEKKQESFKQQESLKTPKTSKIENTQQPVQTFEPVNKSIVKANESGNGDISANQPEVKRNNSEKHGVIKVPKYTIDTNVSVSQSQKSPDQNDQGNNGDEHQIEAKKKNVAEDLSPSKEKKNEFKKDDSSFTQCLVKKHGNAYGNKHFNQDDQNNQDN